MQCGAVAVGPFGRFGGVERSRLIVDGLPNAWQPSTHFPTLLCLQDLLDLLKNRVASIFGESLQAQLDPVVAI